MQSTAKRTPIPYDEALRNRPMPGHITASTYKQAWLERPLLLFYSSAATISSALLYS